MASDAVKSFCNVCSGSTTHGVFFKDSTYTEHPDGSCLERRVLLIRCGGCGEPTIRDEMWTHDALQNSDSEPSFFQRAYKPTRQWTRAPSWVSDIEEIDVDLKYLLDEVYSAANESQVRLLAMGVRAALDHTMCKVLGGDIGRFDEKLDMMVDRKQLAEIQKENLTIVIDAASASSHRGYKPPPELIKEMVVVMESIIREHYITKPMLETAKTLIPPRPPRQKKPVLNGSALEAPKTFAPPHPPSQKKTSS